MEEFEQIDQAVQSKIKNLILEGKIGSKKKGKQFYEKQKLKPWKKNKHPL